MNSSRQILSLGPVVAAVVVISLLGIALPLYLAYEFDHDIPAEVEVSADQGDAHERTSHDEAPHLMARAEAASATLSDPFVDAAPESASADSGNPLLVPPISEPEIEASQVSNDDRTSWELPYQPAYWKASGWEFNAEGMLSGRDESAAMFRRAYVRFMLECRIEPQDEMAGPLKLRLKGSQPGALMTVAIDGRRLVATDDSRIPAAVIKEETVSHAATAGEPVRLKLAATGNRLIVSWDGEVVLTCNQIAAQSGHTVQFAFASSGAPWLIRDLRVEGE